MQKFLKIGKTTHYPVLHREINDLVSEYILTVEDFKGPSVMLFDGTFGGGNHSIPLLEAHKGLKILGTDLDKETLD